MRIKVKVAEADKPFEIHYIDAGEGSNVDTFLNRLVMEKLIHVNGMHQFTCSGYENNELKFQELKSLFAEDSKVKLTSPVTTLTLTMKQNTNDRVHHWLLDYTEFIKMAHHYYDTAEKNEIEPGTLFFIQHNYDKVIVKYFHTHLDFYYMDNNFDEIMEHASPAPDLKIHFKSRDNLSKNELKWIRSISFPDRLPKNPVLETMEIKSQQDVDEVTVLLHRIITIIGRFQRAQKPLEQSAMYFPSYVQAGEAATIGYVSCKQLQNLKK